MGIGVTKWNLVGTFTFVHRAKKEFLCLLILRTATLSQVLLTVTVPCNEGMEGRELSVGKFYGGPIFVPSKLVTARV